MFRIFGITYTFTTNYGSCLQAYALKAAIESMKICGEKPEYSLIPIARCPGYTFGQNNGFKKKIKRLINNHTRKQFIGFENENMRYAPIVPLDELSTYNKMADAFVCGSDVIWNPKFNHGVSAFYLDFAQKYAFSYAASFGQSDIDDPSLAKIGSLISRLRKISVRENTSAEIAKKCTNKMISITVDPVLLLNRQSWDAIASKDKLTEKFILVYTVNSSPLLKEFASKLSRQTGLKVIYSGGNAGAVFKQGVVRSFTPERWLQMIRDAQYVITDSFHGTAFAVLYQKTLYTIVNGDPDAGFNMRMSNFLKDIDLGHRIYTSVPDTINCEAVDYSTAEKMLNEKIAYSLNYLRQNLEDAYKEKLELESKEN